MFSSSLLLVVCRRNMFYLCYLSPALCHITVYDFMFLILCCDVRNDFCIKWCSVRLYPQLFVGGSCLIYVCLPICYSGVKHVLVVRVTWWVSYKRQELLTLREHLCSPPVFSGVRVAHRFSFLCCVFVLFVFVLCLVYPLLPVFLDCPFRLSLWFSRCVTIL